MRKKLQRRLEILDEFACFQVGVSRGEVGVHLCGPARMYDRVFRRESNKRRLRRIDREIRANRVLLAEIEPLPRIVSCIRCGIEFMSEIGLLSHYYQKH